MFDVSIHLLIVCLINYYHTKLAFEPLELWIEFESNKYISTYTNNVLAFVFINFVIYWHNLLTWITYYFYWNFILICCMYSKKNQTKNESTILFDCNKTYPSVEAVTIATFPLNLPSLWISRALVLNALILDKLLLDIIFNVLSIMNSDYRAQVCVF